MGVMIVIYFRDHYITQVKWVDGRHQLVVVWSNRVQNKSVTTVCRLQYSAFTFNCQIVYVTSKYSNIISFVLGTLFEKVAQIYDLILQQNIN